jgi:hypothetical protein
MKEYWECCDLTRDLKADCEMKEFFKTHKARLPMDPREAFFGGRTNAVTLYHKVKNGEKGHYVDICSMYPWVCKFGIFPIGHPEYITENFQEISADNQPYFGLIKAKVLPPKYLRHCTLPERIRAKLMFSACRKCAELNQQEDCEHSDDERALDAAWCSLKLDAALQLGYKYVNSLSLTYISQNSHLFRVLEVFEVWHYDESKRHVGLFADYINTFLKDKLESSGFPSYVKTAEQQEEYIQKIEVREGIRLESDKIQKNKGRRTVAKIALNAFWGEGAIF